MKKKKVYVPYKNTEIVAYEKDGVVGRTCKNCDVHKPHKDFFKVLTNMNKEGKIRYVLFSYCKICSPKQTRKWRNRSFVNRQISNMKNRSRIIGVEYGLAKEDFPTMPLKCPVFDIDLDYAYTKRSENKASIDRIDNDKGYVPDNVMIMSWRANRLKNSASLKELWMFSTFWKKWIEENRPEILEGLDM